MFHELFEITAVLLLFLQVLLQPSVLARKRVWNPKYPICIQLAEGERPLEEEGRTGDSQGEEPGIERATQRRPTPKSAHDLPTTLYLFGRTGRAKEEWFHHFLAASMVTEREKEREKERASRSVSRSGRRNISNAFKFSMERGKIKPVYIIYV